MAAAGEAHPERSDEPLDPGAERRRQGANHLGNAGRGRSFCPGQGHGFLLPLLRALWPRPEGEEFWARNGAFGALLRIRGSLRKFVADAR